MKTTLQIVLESLFIAISIGAVSVGICALGRIIYGLSRVIKTALKPKAKKIVYKNLSIEK